MPSSASSGRPDFLKLRYFGSVATPEPKTRSFWRLRFARQSKAVVVGMGCPASRHEDSVLRTDQDEV